MPDNLLLRIGPAFSRLRLSATTDYSASYIKYLYQDAEGFDTSAGTYVGFPASVIAMGGFAAGTFLATVPGFPSAPKTLVQLPKMLRIFPDTTSGSYPAAIGNFYPRLLVDLGEMIDAASVGTLHGITEQTGYSGIANGRWLSAAIPNPGDTDPTHVVAGKTFVICYVAEAFPVYHTNSNPGPTLFYNQDFAAFTAKWPRFQKFGGIVFHYPAANGARDATCITHLQHAIDGSGGYPGALADYGWHYLAGSNNEPSATFWPYVRDFFGLS